MMSSSLKTWNCFVSVALIIVTAIIIVAIGRMDYTPYSKGMIGATVTYERCKVISVLDESLGKSTYSSDILVGKQELEVKMLTGKHKGETLTATNHLSTYNSVVGKKGRQLTVIVDELNSGKFQIRVYNYSRASYIYLFALVFLLTMVVVSGKKGLMSCLSLIIPLSASCSSSCR